MICRTRMHRTATLKTIPEEAPVLGFQTSTAGNSSCQDGATTEPQRNWLLEQELESHHRLVNRSREHRNIPPLQRNLQLDKLALAHAQYMSENQAVYHSVHSVDALRRKLHCSQVGENIQRGKSIFQMHRDTMASSRDSAMRKNMLRQHKMRHTQDQAVRQGPQQY